MFGLGMGELVIILAIALLFLGPSKLPQLASGLGKAIRSFKKATSGATEALEADPQVGPSVKSLKAAVNGETTAS